MTILDAKLAKIYYGPGGYWKGNAVIKKLSMAAKVTEDAAKKVAEHVSPLANLPSRAKAHSSGHVLTPISVHLLPSKMSL